MGEVTIKTIASGSSGNCYLIDDGTSKILIECGIPIDKIKLGVNFQLSSIDGCLLTHEHGDHSHAAKELVRAGIDLYTSEGTASVLGLSGYGVKHLKARKLAAVGGYQVLPFDTKHDVAEPLGFLVKSKATGESLVFATDTFYIEQRFVGVTHYMIEANYLESSLEYYEKHQPEIVKRLVSSHMSGENCVKFLKSQDLSKTKSIHLIHLSRDRADPETIRKMVERATGKMVIIAGEEL